MLETLGKLANRIADYTIGTAIVLVHVALADRARLALPGEVEGRKSNVERPRARA